MLSITARNVDSENKTCARCYCIGNMFEMESLQTNRGSEYRTLYFHPDCFDKYEHAKLCIQKGVSGIEIDMAGNRVNIERTLAVGNKFRAQHDMDNLIALLKTKKDPEAWLKSFMEKDK